MLFSLLFAVTTAGATFPRPEGPVLPLFVRDKVEAFHAAERELKLHEGHESVIRIHENDAGEPIRTPRTALVISGLFNSPRGMRRLEEYFFARGENVVNMRLAGHWELDTHAIAETVTWDEWREQSVKAFALAKELGDKVTLVGHSTGGLLGLWLAIDHPEDVAALAVFAPALGLSAALRLLLSVPTNQTIKRWNLLKPFDPPRVLTLHAGREVERLGHEFHEHLARADLLPIDRAAARLENIPVWMANTGFDRIIDLASNDDFARALALAENAAARGHERIHACNFLLHDHLAGGKHRHWRRLMNSLARTIYDD